MDELISKAVVIDTLKRIDVAIDEGLGFNYEEWVDYVNELPTISTTTHETEIKSENNEPYLNNDLISRKAVLRLAKEVINPADIGEYNAWNKITKVVEKLPTIPQVVCDDDCEHCSWVECPLAQEEREEEE